MLKKEEVMLALVGLLNKPTTQGMLLLMWLAPNILLGYVLFQLFGTGMHNMEDIRKNTMEISIAIREMCHQSIASARKNEP